jgi:hypothetical protein
MKPAEEGLDLAAMVESHSLKFITAGDARLSFGINGGELLRVESKELVCAL